MAQFILPLSRKSAPLGQIAVAQTIASPTSSGDFTIPGGGGWRIIAMMLSVDTGTQVGAWNATVVAQGGGLVFPNNADRVGLADGEWSPAPENEMVGGQTYTVNASAVDAGATAATVYVLIQKKDAYCA